MARIKIEDLPEKALSREEMLKVYGGLDPQPEPPMYLSPVNSLYRNVSPLSSQTLKIESSSTMLKI